MDILGESEPSPSTLEAGVHNQQQSMFTLQLKSTTLIRPNHQHPRRWNRHQKSTWILAHQPEILKNNLLTAIGFLELGNATDFAANVWNETPVPIYAVILMALGGPIAMMMSIFAFRDARLSWVNISLLRKERYALLAHRKQLSLPERDRAEPGRRPWQEVRGRKQHADAISIDTLLDVNQSELGTEIVDRLVLDLLMGVGAILVGIGTLLAIGGANRKVWLASNLLSGYIGNSPAAMYGLFNFGWSTYIWLRANRHSVAETKIRELKQDGVDDDHSLLMVQSQLKSRLRIVRLHAVVNGVTGVIAGIASPITATRWWAYVILIPCIMSSVWCNYFWRKVIAYERPLRRHPERISKVALLKELRFVCSIRRALNEAQVTTAAATEWKLSHTLPAPWLKGETFATSSSSSLLGPVLDFIIQNDLFESFCLHLINSYPSLPPLASSSTCLATSSTSLSSTALFVTSNRNADSDPDPRNVEILTFTAQQLMQLDSHHSLQILHIANEWITTVGPLHFRYRQRFLLEILGCYLARAA